jgi:Ser/Thr protein kinase RdoA (MazF antagonist)
MLEDHLSLDHVTTHLSTRNITVERVTKLDWNVYRVDIDSEPSLVARVYPSTSTCDAAASTSSLVKLLEYLHTQGFPAERCASPQPLSELDDHTGCVLLTEFAHGQRPERNRLVFGRMGKLLGKLHTLPIPDTSQPGGAWHHLTPTGGIIEECNAAIQKLQDFAPSAGPDDQAHIQVLLRELRLLEQHFRDRPDLPTSIVHPDFVPSNIIAQPQESDGTPAPWTVIDWAGAGVGTRIISLGFLLAVAGARGKDALVDTVMKGYSGSVTLEESELASLSQAVYVRLFTIQCWEIANGRKKAGSVVNEFPALVENGENVAKRVRKILNG